MAKIKKIPVGVLSTDWHVKDNNPDILDLISQQCDVADEKGVDLLLCAGDAFTSRVGQKVDTLTIMGEVFALIHARGKKIWLIPGNHDKQNYDSVDSFLTPYRHFPGVMIVDKAGGIPFDGGVIHMLPYFKEDIWLQKLEDLIKYIGKDKGRKHILISHQAVNGSINNDGSEVSCGIAHSHLMSFDSVFLGHYHDYQQPFPNTYHIPSIKQHNFGENTNKGFAVLYSDGSFDIVNSVFKQFIKHKLDLSEVSVKEALKLIKNALDPVNNIRFELTGSKELLKSFPKEEAESLGVSITMKDIDVERSLELFEEEIVEYNNQSIADEFELFCEEKGYDTSAGLPHLNKKLQVK